MSSVLDAGQTVQIHDISNLSSGGTAIDVTVTVAERWVDLARSIAHDFGLRFCGVDLAVMDIEDDGGDYVVIEVNSTPGLDHYGSVGAEQEAIVCDLYARVLSSSPAPTAASP
jgi:glutathione synthase/RimK-type ligase-like ATP-grasp enzyme